MLERKRKFAIAFVALVMTFVLALLEYVDGNNWVTAMGLIVGLYGTVEAAEGFANARTQGARNGN